MKTYLDDKLVTVACAIDTLDDGFNLYPLFVLVDDELLKRLQPPEESNTETKEMDGTTPNTGQG